MRRILVVFVPILVGLLFFLSGQAGAADKEQISTLADQQEVAVTIYNENLALVKDKRVLRLPAGDNTLAFREVSARLRPETALMRSVSHPRALSVIEQNFDFDLLTPGKMLEKYVGRQVKVVRTHPTTGEETLEEAVVLSANEGVVLRMGDRIETGVPGRLIFPDVPENLRDRPTLVMLLQSATDQEQQVELSYLTGGLAWKADYVAELSPDEKQITINGWVTLTNTSGTTYKRATLQLMAGDVQQVGPAMLMSRKGMFQDMAMEAEAPAMREESLFEYHLYTLERPTTIRENQTKQVAMLEADRVAARKEYELHGQQHYYQSRMGDLGDRIKVGVFLAFANTEKDGLGKPLPMGVVRVYKKDSQGNVQFVGEDRIDHTPANEEVRLRLGNAFDVTAKRKQTDFNKLAGFARYNYHFESAFEVELKNARDQEVVVKVVEPLPGDWEIVSESDPHTKESAGTASWNIRIPAKGASTLAYRVRVRY